MNHDAVHSTRERLARRLSEEEIPYAVIGGMALNLHGYERMTRDVDVLMMPTGGSTFILLTDGLGAAM